MPDSSAFAGFPVAALDFYDDLEMDNTKSFWTAHKRVYDEAVRVPMTALVTALEDEFGPAKVFRPYRDVRFAKDKTPYKDHQGAFVAHGPSTGWYVQIGAPGVRVSVGFYDASSERLGAIRDAIADDRTGKELERIVADLEAGGWTRGGERLKTSPRGYDADHPRIDLLRHKALFLSRSYGFEPVIHTPQLLDRVRADWRAGRPLVDWVATHAG
jgi:uncharacterized protein (TIGR02453 family)